jgi:myosin phosphatase Rho-interacting protein
MAFSDSPTLFYEDVIRDEKLKDIANKITSISTQEKDRKNRWTMSEIQLDETPTRDDVNSSSKQKRPQSLSIVSSVPSIISVVKKKSGPAEIINYRKSSQSHERGDPDGDCGMEDSPTSYCNKTGELRVKLPSEEILHCKSGWLMKEDHKEWSKYWFSLKGGGLFYYRDPSAEERGVLDGVLDVNSITSIKELSTTNRNHAFQLTVITSLIFSFLISLFFPIIGFYQHRAE